MIWGSHWSRVSLLTRCFVLRFQQIIIGSYYSQIPFWNKFGQNKIELGFSMIWIESQLTCYHSGFTSAHIKNKPTSNTTMVTATLSSHNTKKRVSFPILVTQICSLSILVECAEKGATRFEINFLVTFWDLKFSLAKSRAKDDGQEPPQPLTTLTSPVLVPQSKFWRSTFALCPSQQGQQEARLLKIDFWRDDDAKTITTGVNCRQRRWRRPGPTGPWCWGSWQRRPGGPWMKGCVTAGDWRSYVPDTAAATSTATTGTGMSRRTWGDGTCIPSSAGWGMRPTTNGTAIRLLWWQQRRWRWSTRSSTRLNHPRHVPSMTTLPPTTVLPNKEPPHVVLPDDDDDGRRRQRQRT